jgi:cyclase
MLAKRIIPCLDVKNGRVVKGIQFENLRDAGDPVELGKYYVEERADELVFLDITASKEKRPIVYDLVERVAQQVFIPFTIGGGLTSIAAIREILSRGADKISLNTAAVRTPELISAAADAFGSQCVVVAIDVKKVAQEIERLGAGEILLTSMDHDGSKAGFALEITSQISRHVNIPVIASGGGGSLQHFAEVFEAGSADAALAASIFHYKEFRIRDVKTYLRERNITVRM